MKKILGFILVLGLVVLAFFQLDFQKFGFHKSPGCAFCNPKIIEQQIFYRGNHSLGILDHKPAVPGHVLIIPTRHVERFEDLTPEEVAELGETIKKVDMAVRKAFGTGDYILVQKNGREAGQTVPHVHFHYLPASRFLAARFFLAPWLKPLNESELRARQEIISHFGNATP